MEICILISGWIFLCGFVLTLQTPNLRLYKFCFTVIKNVLIFGIVWSDIKTNVTNDYYSMIGVTMHSMLQ